METVVRYIQEPDVRPLLNIEKAVNQTTFDDPDFGVVQWFNPWTFYVDDLMRRIRQRKEEDKGVADTRTYVIEKRVKSQAEDGTDVLVPEIAGGFCYEIRPDGLVVIFFAAPPDVLGDMLDWLKAKAARSPARKKVTLHVRDSEQANIRGLIPVLFSRGFLVKLRPNFFDDMDGWEFTYDTGN